MHQLFLALLFATFSEPNAGADWCYQSQVTCENQCMGPDQWAEVGGADSCGGKSQSPINIVTRKTLPDGRLSPFQFRGYQEVFNGFFRNNGHSVQLDLPSNATISGGSLGTVYKAVQLHLHWGQGDRPGSEHMVDGERYPMELHIVHISQSYDSLTEALKDPSGVAVLGFFYQESLSANKKYEPFIRALRDIKEPDSNTTLSGVSLDMLIPSQQNLTDYYRYQGSLTTPGCAEAVVWTLLQQTIPLSQEQLSAFHQLRFPNGEPMVGTFRPVQPINSRVVYRSAGRAVLASIAVVVLMAIGPVMLS